MNTENFPETLQEAMTFFSNEDNAFNFLVSYRWPKGVSCPRCGSDKVGFIATRKTWECKNCATKKQFSAKVGTIFEDSPIKLSKWFSAIWLVTNAKNGISSCEVARALGVTQKSAWFMLQRIRLALQNGTIVKVGGEVEVDETYIGGKARNMHKSRRNSLIKKRTGGYHMTPVQGLLQRPAKGHSKIMLKVPKTRLQSELLGNVKEYVLKNSTVYTDATTSYRSLGKDGDFAHEVIDHATTYVNGKIHTNGIENFWSLLKRGIRGTYVSVEPFHLFRYLDEQAFRFNERKDTDSGRFMKAVAGIFGKGLKYVDLIGKGGDDLQQEMA
jgi:transposase-like protein